MAANTALTSAAADHAAAASASKSIHLRVPSRPDWIEAIVMLLANQALVAGVADERGIGRLVVAITEGITNAVVHGNLGVSSDLKTKPGEFARALAERTTSAAFVGRLLDVRFDREPRRFVWTITDEGDGFDVPATLRKLEEEQPEEALPAGRGIAIMQAFVDSVAWSLGGRRLELAINVVEQAEQRLNSRMKYTAAVELRDASTPFRHRHRVRGGARVFRWKQRRRHPRPRPNDAAHGAGEDRALSGHRRRALRPLP